MFEEDDDLQMLCEECDNDDEDSDEIDNSLCVLDFSYYGQPPFSTSTYAPVASIIAPFNQPTRSQDEMDIDREMKEYADSKMQENNNDDDEDDDGEDESETMTCESDIVSTGKAK